MAHRATRRRLAVGLAALAVVTSGLTACAAGAARFVPGVGPGAGASRSAGAPTSAATDAAGATFTLSAVGDTIMASAPKFLPPNGGRDLFASVESSLGADLQMANLEEPLTNATTSPKCGNPPAANCFAYRAPTSYANVLHDAGFDLVNIANNHTLDYGTTGRSDTERSLTDAGVAYTGPPGMITTVTVKGIRVAVLGFAPYAWANDLRDIAAGQALVRRAKQHADVVIVQAHMGGEGAAYQHVKPGPEIFLGENRGDAIAFSHAMIDAGADIVIGHSPHVLRAMEFYKGHLIAYSLGNFTGYHALSSNGPNGISMILHVTLRRDGSFVSATMVPIEMAAPGVPRLDPSDRAIPLVSQLTAADFPTTGARISASGAITPITG
ncbi:MAG TPA: CapA family protein [Micromonosporaceae bacterium]|jgi:poly-gamma-glutamate capsule biosynthesis protein CapA/YwtB (metallophosphatase superfamily)|nr:CapA family protein [Micromonosporaceae bacterium]